MTGKNPAFQFYPNDYFRDTRVLTPGARGIWMDVLCVLWWTDPKVRQKTLPVSDWSRLLSVTTDEFSSAISEFKRHNICDVSQDCHGNVTLMSRRMVRDDNKREDDLKRKHKQRAKGTKSKSSHTSVTDLSRLSSSSSSSSVTKVTLSGEAREGDEIYRILKTAEAMSGMTYEQDLDARRSAGWSLHDPELEKIASDAVLDAGLMGSLDHPAMWWKRFLERRRSGSSTGFLQKKEMPVPRVCDPTAPEVL